MKRLVFDETGGPLVELALAMPMLTLILLGAVSLGQLAMGAINVSNAAKAAVQYAAQDSNTAVDTATMLAMARADVGTTIGQTGALDMPKAVGLPAVAACTSTGTTTISYSCSYCQCSSPNSAAAPFACATANPNTVCGTSSSQLEQVIVVSTHIKMKPVAAIPGLPLTFDMYGRGTEKRLQ